jgi:phosphoglycerate dehydrogenase-like enzyme
MQLREKTIGVVGLGRIGLQMVELLVSFNAKDIFIHHWLIDFCSNHIAIYF